MEMGSSQISDCDFCLVLVFSAARDCLLLLTFMSPFFFFFFFFLPLDTADRCGDG